MDKILVLGASGQVGTQLMVALGEQAVATSRAEREGWLRMDIAQVSNLADVGALLDRVGLRAIYCVGAMTHVDGCEAEPDLAWKTNARGPGVMAAYARQRRLPFVFFSTDYVFGGTPDNPGPYDEQARRTPQSVYGRTKQQGEQRVLDEHPEALVVRTTGVYGADPREKNFLYSLMLSLGGRTKMRVPMDQVSTPTYNRDLVAAMLGLVEAGASGIFHVAGPELMSRLDFALQAAAWLGLDADLIEGVTTAELSQAAPRPLHAGLNTAKLHRMYPNLRLCGLVESLADCGQQLQRFMAHIDMSGKKEDGIR